MFALCIAARQYGALEPRLEGLFDLGWAAVLEWFVSLQLGTG